MPKSGGIALNALIMHEVDYEIVDGLLMGSCDKSKYRPISLLINDKYFFELSPDSFVLDIGQGDKCFLPFLTSNEDHWVLGEPFFRNYYSVYDVEKGLIGIAPSINVPSARIYEGQAPAEKLPDRHNPSSDSADARKKLPSLNDPFSVIQFMFSNAWSTITGTGSKPSRTKPTDQAGTWTTIATFISVAVLACSCCCLCAGGLAYITYEFNR